MPRWLLALLAVTVAGGWPPPTRAAAAPGRAAAVPAATAALPATRAAVLTARWVIDTCVKRLDREVDIGYAHIARRCPGLAAELTGSPFRNWLPADWNQPDNRLTAAGLEQLGSLLDREQARTGLRQAPRAEHAAAALAHLSLPHQADGWWARFKRWLRNLAVTRAAVEVPWWQRWLGSESLSQAAWRAIAWSAVALLLGMAAWVLINELRVAGLLRDPRRTRTAGAAAGSAGAAPAEDPERLSLERQPAALLDLLTRRLAEHELLPPARAFTARQVVRHAHLTAAADRERLAQLADVSEQLRFSDHALAPAQIAAAVAQGRALLAALEPGHARAVA